VAPLAWHLGPNPRVALDEEYQLRDAEARLKRSRAGTCQMIRKTTWRSSPEEGPRANPTRAHAHGHSIEQALIGYLSPSLSTSRVSTTEVMPGTLFATSLA